MLTKTSLLLGKDNSRVDIVKMNKLKVLKQHWFSESDSDDEEDDGKQWTR